MPIDFEKSAPLMLGGRYYYALTSYDPVKVEVIVPRVTDADVELAIQTILANEGGTLENLDDPAWLAQNTPGVSSADEMRAYVRAELGQLNAEMVERQKADQCVNELVRRLRQAIPASVVDELKGDVQEAFAQQLEREGMNLGQFLARSGITPAELKESFEQEARLIAERNAALDAYAREKKLSVTDAEIAAQMRLPDEDAADFIQWARQAGQYDALREESLRIKARDAAIAECDCTYHHETEEEAAERVRQAGALRAQLEAEMQRISADQPAEPSGPAGLHLV